jgi:hypothetical protein
LNMDKNLCRQFLLLCLLTIGLTICKAQFPHIAGTIIVSIKKGTLQADLEVTNFPKIGGTYSILLNAGLNVRYFRDSTDNYNYHFDRYFDGKVSDEAFQYYFPSNKRTTRFLPSEFKISYVGAFPVISDTLKASNGGDWKGNIAFNGDYIRAAEQTAWYPIIYDTLNDVKLSKVTYDLKIICEDGKSIYLNGSPPVSGQTARITSKIPVELLLFAGNFDYTLKDKTYFLNTDLNDKQQTVLSSWSNKIKNFYEQKLKVPYGYPITYLAATPISKKQAWSFVTYPTVAVIGRGEYTLKEYFDPKTHQLKDSSDIGHFSHELGHYYFGTYFVPNAELKWMFLEGITEYISLQTVRQVLGEQYYKQKIAKYIKEIGEDKFMPLSSVSKAADIDDNYRYNYVPLLLTALEKEVGVERVWAWLNVVLTSKNAKSNYEFFKATLLKSGLTPKAITDFENKYIIASDAKQATIDKTK